MNEPSFTIVLQQAGAGPPAEVRLRRLLKLALRQHGFRCISVTRTADDVEAANVPPSKSAAKTPASNNS